MVDFVTYKVFSGVYHRNASSLIAHGTLLTRMCHNVEIVGHQTRLCKLRYFDLGPSLYSADVFCAEKRWFPCLLKHKIAHILGNSPQLAPNITQTLESKAQ